MVKKFNEQFPLTKISKNLPEEIKAKLERVINYRFGILPESNMITTEVLSCVEPHKIYRFTLGSLSPVKDSNQQARVSEAIITPKYTEIEGEWTAQLSHARKEANVLGKFGSFYTKETTITLQVEEATKEKLAYYGAVLLNEGDDMLMADSEALPVNVVRFDRNYREGYLKLPEYGGGYYLEVHNTPHLWSHLSPEGAGVLLLGKNIKQNFYHLSAFTIPFPKAIYIPGGVIHCDGLLIGDVMAIYTVTPQYSTVIIKDLDDNVVNIQLVTLASLSKK